MNMLILYVYLLCVLVFYFINPIAAVLQLLTTKIQMHKHKYYKPPKPSTLPQKPLDTQSRPQFVTDFSDPDKYKLSQAEMIQRKAALQSKNRQAAKQNLEERRKKLQMGIIDEDTRKVYQTALTSKKIDLNPSIRRNLSQMIQYEREKIGRNSSANRNSRSRERKNEDNSEQEQEQGFEDQIKKNQQFIKKLQRAKKQDNIGKAVQILLNDKKSSHFGPTKSSVNTQTNGSSTKIFKNSTLSGDMDNIGISASRVSNMSQQQTLSNIEETIKFMEQKLFNPNWKKNKSNTEQQTSKDIIITNTNTNKMTNNNAPYKSTSNDTKQPMKSSNINKYIQQQQQQNNTSHNEFLSQLKRAPQSQKPSHVSPGSYKQEPSQLDIDQQLQSLRLNFNTNVNRNKQPIHNNSKMSSLQCEQTPKNKMGWQQQDDDCLATIRDMKDMMQSKSHKHKENNHIQSNNYNRSSNMNSNMNVKLSNNTNVYNVYNVYGNSQRSNKTYRTDGDAQVDFSLTMNQQQIAKYNTNNNNNNAYENDNDNEDDNDEYCINVNMNKSKNNNNKNNNSNNNNNNNNKNKNILTNNSNSNVFANTNTNTNVNKNTNTNKNSKNYYQQLKKQLFQQIDKLQQQQLQSQSQSQSHIHSHQHSQDISYNHNHNHRHKNKQPTNTSNNIYKNTINSNTTNNIYGHSYQEQQEQQDQCQYQIPVQYQHRTTAIMSNSSGMGTINQINGSYTNSNTITSTSIGKNTGASISANNYSNINSSNKTNLQIQNQSMSSSSVLSKQLEQLKSMVASTKNNVSKIQVQPIAINHNPITSTKTGTTLMGFDYRGSINIKKHIVSTNP